MLKIPQSAFTVKRHSIQIGSICGAFPAAASYMLHNDRVYVIIGAKKTQPKNDEKGSMPHEILQMRRLRKAPGRH
jgi:hypothetical protein